jgi:ABC-type oligopeptide transport system ATPase subunit
MRARMSCDGSDAFGHPQHPYTEALFLAVPVPDP